MLISKAKASLGKLTEFKNSLWIILAIFMVGLLSIAGVAFGSVNISAFTILEILTHKIFGFSESATWSSAQESIVWNVRLPRVILAAVVGAGLAVSGAVLQAMVRNILADPYLLGISSGASAGATASILFGVGAAVGVYALPISAFIGALLASFAVFLLSRLGGKVTAIRLVMAGVAVGYVLSAVASILVFSSDNPEGTRSVMFWLLGSLSLAQWNSALLIVVVTVILSIALTILWARKLDVLSIGDETTLALGINPSIFRIQLLIVVSLCVGVIVSISGTIGFVGLVLPHLGRKVVGSAHRSLLPFSALLGAGFLIASDLIARTIWVPRELPIGVVTALIGAPVLIVLVRKFQSGQQS